MGDKLSQIDLLNKDIQVFTKSNVVPYLKKKTVIFEKLEPTCQHIGSVLFQSISLKRVQKT